MDKRRSVGHEIVDDYQRNDRQSDRSNDLRYGYRRLAGDLTGLAVYYEVVDLAVELVICDPDRCQNVFKRYLGEVSIEVYLLDRVSILSLFLILADLILKSVPDLVLCDLPAVIQADCISLGKEACDEFRRVRTDLLEIKVLYGIDVRVIRSLTSVNNLVIYELLVDAREMLIFILGRSLAL